MTGKNHVSSNIASGMILGSAGCVLNTYQGPFASIVHCVIDFIYRNLILPQDGLPWFCWVTTSAAMFILGSLLPDTDNEGSSLTPVIRLPFEHRTWTHTMWAVCLLLLPVFWYRVLFWLAFGYFLHLFWDSLSYCGVCYFYPISKYRVYASGAKVKINHPCKVYRVGATSETVLMAVLWTSAIFITGFTAYILLVLK